MATKGPKDTSAVYIPDSSIIEFGKLNLDDGQFITGPPPGGDNFAWYGRPRGTSGEWIFLTDLITSGSWSDDLETGSVSGSLTLDNRPDGDGNRIMNRLPEGSEITQMYLPFGMDIETLSDLQASGKQADGTGLQEINRFILWEGDRESGGSLNYTVEIYDLMKMLIESEITVFYDMTGRKKQWSPTEITKDICKNQAIQLLNVPTSTNHIPFFYQESTSIRDVLVKLWTLDHKVSNRNFFIRMYRGKLQILVKESTPPSQVLYLGVEPDNNGGVLISSTKTGTMDGLKTGARFWGSAKATNDTNGEDDRKAVASSKPYINQKAMNQYGRLWHEETVQGVTSQAKLDKTAQQYVKDKSGITYSGSVNLIGLPWLRAGDPVRLSDPDSGLVGLYWFKQIDHTVDGSGTYTATGDMRNYDYTFSEMPDRSDLKPELQPGGAPGDGLTPAETSALENSTASPSSVQQVIASAASAAGVPASWATDPSLAQLLQMESSFKWRAQNPTSTAFGLFQFLDSTWAGTGVPKKWASPAVLGGDNGHPVPGFQGPASPDQPGGWHWWQCVAGLKYIKSRYGTPAKALAHELSHNPHWY